LDINPAEAAVILQNSFMQPAHALPETACFSVPVIRPAGQDRCPVVMERHIAVLPILARQQHRFHTKYDRRTSRCISARLERILPPVYPYRQTPLLNRQHKQPSGRRPIQLFQPTDFLHGRTRQCPCRMGSRHRQAAVLRLLAHSLRIRCAKPLADGMHVVNLADWKSSTDGWY